MRRRAKPVKAKVEAKLPVARRSRKNEGSRVRDLEKRLEEALHREAEALEQQTATSEILGVISSSPTDVRPVLESIVRSAVRLCAARQGAMMMVRDGLVHLEVQCNNTEQWLDVARDMYPIQLEKSAVGIALQERRVLHFPDVETDGAPSTVRALARAGGYRTAVLVPIMKDGVGLGVIGIGKDEPLSDSQIELLKTFAAQAVIAIENVRLFKELEARNRDLTATGEILQVISRSPTDVQPVFDTIVQSAAKLCNAYTAAVFRTDGNMLYHPANFGASPDVLAAARARYPRPLDMETAPGVSILTRSVAHVPDIEDPSVTEHIRHVARLLGFRSLISVPMLREGEAVGAIVVARQEPGRLSEAAGGGM
jgi:GAF domain-containing protein